MFRPRWIMALLACFALAGGFAWLGQWQLSRSIDFAPPEAGISEVERPIAELLGPGDYLTSRQEGHRVTVAGNFVPGDFRIITERDDAGTDGYWVAGQFRLAQTAEPTSIAIALGFTTDLDVAQEAVRTASTWQTTLTGRLFPDEGVGVPPAHDPYELTSMSPAGLLGIWHDTENLHVYRAFMLSDTAIAPLEVITTSPPDEGTRVSWINIFYAAEWIIFAGFALYIWYRLAKDAWERETEDFEEAAAAAASGSLD